MKKRALQPPGAVCLAARLVPGAVRLAGSVPEMRGQTWADMRPRQPRAEAGPGATWRAFTRTF